MKQVTMTTSEGTIVLDVLMDGASAAKSGAPAPFVQFDVPPSVRLTGKHLTTHRELANNEFIQEPYEQLLEESPGFVPFEIEALSTAGFTPVSMGERTLRVDTATIALLAQIDLLRRYGARLDSSGGSTPAPTRER